MQTHNVTDGTVRNSKRAAWLRGTIEHLRQRSEGGSDQEDNLAMACAFCNNARADRTISEMKAYAEVLKEQRRHPCFVAAMGNWRESTEAREAKKHRQRTAMQMRLRTNAPLPDQDRAATGDTGGGQ